MHLIFFFGNVDTLNDDDKLHLCFRNQSLYTKVTAKNEKEPGTTYQSLFRLPNMFRSFLSLMIHHLAIF